MKRRSFLAILGLSPVAAVVAAPAIAENSSREIPSEVISNVDYPICLDSLTTEVREHLCWIGEVASHRRALIGQIETSLL